MASDIVSWESKLLSFGVPLHIAERMAVSLIKLPHTPEQFANINQLIPIIQQYDFQALDWWEDLMLWLQQFIQTLMQITPGIVLTAVGGVLVYALWGKKYRNVPMGIIGLIPLGVGLWMIVQPFLYPQGGV